MKKIIFFILFILITNLLYSDNFLNDVLYNGNLAPLDNLIEPQQLINFTLYDLRILRNMIYAKYNYRFRNNDLREYFSKFTWYNGTESNVENSLTYIDHRNVRMIRIFENSYPYFISLYDYRDNLFNYRHPMYFQQYHTFGGLTIMGWSADGKILYTAHNLNSLNLNTENFLNIGLGTYFNHFGIIDLKENKILWNKPIGHLNKSNYEEIISETLEVALEYNIIFMSNYIPIEIEGYNIYSRRNREERLNGDAPWHFFEIGLKNRQDNSIIHLFNLYASNGYDFYTYESFFPNYIYRRISDNDLMYLCIRSPFEENIVLLVVIIEEYWGGDQDGWRSYYSIFGIDLNKINR
jgi:hypothetical protein